MNQQQLLQIVSWLVTTLGGIGVSKGWLTSDQITLVGSFLASGVALGWSFWMSREKGQIKATAALPGVQQIQVSDPGVANSIPSPKVISK